MFDESILELEAIEGEKRWHPLVVEARYNTYRDAKQWELAKTMAEVSILEKAKQFQMIMGFDRVDGILANQRISWFCK